MKARITVMGTRYVNHTLFDSDVIVTLQALLNIYIFSATEPKETNFSELVNLKKFGPSFCY